SGWGVAFVVASVATTEARAQCLQDQPVTSTCRLHLFDGPVLAPSRILALGGAYQGIAEGLEGFSSNAAAPAVRRCIRGSGSATTSTSRSAYRTCSARTATSNTAASPSASTTPAGSSSPLAAICSSVRGAS